MSDTDRVTRITRITNDLNVISSLIPGSTLSTSTMKIVDHTAWSGSFWRTYARENRNETLSHIKRIFAEAISILRVNIQDKDTEYYKDIIVSIQTSIMGILSLKDTYKHDYYTVSEIDSIVENTRKELDSLCSHLPLNSQSTLVETTVTETPAIEAPLPETAVPEAAVIETAVTNNWRSSISDNDGETNNSRSSTSNESETERFMLERNAKREHINKRRAELEEKRKIRAELEEKRKRLEELKVKKSLIS